MKSSAATRIDTKFLDSREIRLVQSLETALGADILRLKRDPEIVEIYTNADGSLWYERLGSGCQDTGLVLSPADRRRVIELVAGGCCQIVNEEIPAISAELPGCGSRFQGMLPPVVEEPIFAIRKKAVKIFTLTDYVAAGIMTETQKASIEEAVQARKNILIVGGTGTGKTTLANAILALIAEMDNRIIIIEDTRELQCSAQDKLQIRSRDNFSMTQALKSTMRLRPDRIVIGEVRDGSALDLLKAWNTGHPGGIATVHANSAHGGLTRLEQLIQEVVATPQRELIAEAINLLIYIERENHGRRIKEIARMEGCENGKYRLTAI